MINRLMLLALPFAIALSVWVISASGQSLEPFLTFLTGLNTASAPLSGNELLYVAQGGVSKKLPVNQLPGALLNVPDQILSGGANNQSFALGTISSGTLTIDCGKNPLQYFTNNGAFTLAAPNLDGSCDILDTNSATPGVITFSGFTVNGNVGEPLTTVANSKFIIHIEEINGTATYFLKALQ